MYGRSPWHGSLEIDVIEDDSEWRDTVNRPLTEVQQGWLLDRQREREMNKKKKFVDLGIIIVRREILVWFIRTLLVAGVVAGLTTLIVKMVPKHHPSPPPPNHYTQALHKALMFFNAQRSGKLPEHNNVTWRGDSGLHDGVIGGFYDAGDAIKFNFPASFAMTMLSWSVIEYNARYEAVGELDHVKEIIKWGADYLLRTFNSSADSIGRIAAQVGAGGTPGGTSTNDHYCWIRPEDIKYPRPVYYCSACSDLAAEMAAALAAASIVFKGSDTYSQKLVHAAETLFKFSIDQHGRYSPDGTDPSLFYNSTGYYDEYVWGAAWMYYATGNASYLQLATTHDVATCAGAFWGDLDYSVLSWDNKLVGAQVLLTRLRLFLSPGYPYEEMLRTYHNQAGIIMCSYLPNFKKFNRTKGGLIQLNHGRPESLQYVVNAAFLASLYADYLEATDTPGWYCGTRFFSRDALRKFSEKQIKYILGKNPQNMSYVVGFGDHFPKHVHHRGASIPKNGIRYDCRGGWQWQDSKKPNPNIINGAMVAGPDGHDGFRDVRKNYNYTEPTLAGNAGLVAALVSLTGQKNGIDKNTIFSSVPSIAGEAVEIFRNQNLNFCK